MLFRSISASNLDEFYMVRVAGLKAQVRAGVSTPSQDGLTPAQQLTAVNQRANRLMERQQRCWRELKTELVAAGIAVIGAAELSAEDRQWVETHFMEAIFPVLTPLAIDPAHPFPFIPNKGFASVLQLQRRSDGRALKALLPFPAQIDRFIRLPGMAIRFLPLEELVTLNLGAFMIYCGVYIEKGIAPVLLAQSTYLWGYVSVEKIVDKAVLKKDVPVMHKMELVRVDKATLGKWARQLKAWGFTDVPEEYLKLP